MKKIIVILISIALYTPATVSIALFTECEINAIIKQVEDCGCSLNTLPHPNEPYNTTNSQQQAQLKLKADWKFVVQSKYCFSAIKKITTSKFLLPTNWQIYSALFDREIFHPPNFVA